MTNKSEIVFTDHPFYVTYRCNLCPDSNFSYDSWFEHIIHHFFDAYLLIIQQFFSFRSDNYCYFPLTCGYETYAPFVFHIVVPMNDGSILQEDIITDFSSICGHMYFRSVINSIASKLVGFNARDLTAKFQPLIFSVHFQKYERIPDPKSFKEYELITIPASFSFSHFMFLSPDALQDILNIYSEEISNAFSTFIRFLAPKYPYYEQCLDLIDTDIPLFLDSRRPDSGYDSIGIKFTFSGPIELVTFRPRSLSSTKIYFGEFLFSILEFIGKDSDTKHSFNLMLTLYYFCIRSSLHDVLLDNLPSEMSVK